MRVARSIFGAVGACALGLACSGPTDETELAKTQQAFSNDFNGETNHEDLTVLALSFLRPDVRNQLASRNVAVDLFEWRNARAHFDNCTFSGASARAAWLYSSAVSNVRQFPEGLSCPSPYPALHLCPYENSEYLSLERFGQVLHTVQDFYSHSNWVELHGLTSDALLDESLGPFPVLDSQIGGYPLASSWAGRVRPADPGLPYPRNLIPHGCRGRTCSQPLLVSADTWPTRFKTFPQECPAEARISHSILAKDESTSHPEQPKYSLAFAAAYSSALRQTVHEWCRFQNLVYEQGLSRGTAAEDVEFLCEKWVDNRAAANAACSAISGFPEEALCSTCNNLLRVTPASGGSGTEVFVTASGYLSGEAVDILFDGTWVGGTCCNPEDPYHDHFFVPDVPSGTYRVNVIGTTTATETCGYFVIP
jgi:hypothetical protein